MLYGVRPPRRRDAERNRSAIVQAASDLMVSRQAIVPMPEIARRAGVGQATLYRHFPDRYALTTAVITHHLDRLEAVAAAHSGHPSMFRHLLHGVLHTQVVMRPLVHLAQALDPRIRDRYQQRMVTLLAPPLSSAQAHGYVRDDLTPDDLILLFTMVQGAADAAGAGMAVEAGATRAIDLLLDGVFRAGTRG